jgi:hypothetical protein
MKKHVILQESGNTSVNGCKKNLKKFSHSMNVMEQRHFTA